MPSRTVKVSGATLTGTQPVRSRPLKSAVKPAGGSLSAAWRERPAQSVNRRRVGDFMCEWGSVKPQSSKSNKFSIRIALVPSVPLVLYVASLLLPITYARPPRCAERPHPRPPPGVTHYHVRGGKPSGSEWRHLRAFVRGYFANREQIHRRAVRSPIVAENREGD